MVKSVFQVSLHIGSKMTSTPTPLHRTRFHTACSDSSSQKLKQHLLSFSNYLLLPLSVSQAFPQLLVLRATAREAFTSTISFHISRDQENMDAQLSGLSQGNFWLTRPELPMPSPNISTSITTRELFLQVLCMCVTWF